VGRILVQHGDAGIVEALWSNDAYGQQRMALDEGTADQPMGDDHQRAVHAATPAHDEGEGIGDARVKCRPVLAVGRRDVGSERILGQRGVGHAAQIAKIALLQQRALLDGNSGAGGERSRRHARAQQVAAQDVNETVVRQAPRELLRLTHPPLVERHVGALQNARGVAVSLTMTHEQDRHAA
jgi:hypothetical protein